VSDYDPTDLRGQEARKAEKAARDRLAREVEDGDLKWLASSKRGRRIIWRLLTQAGVFRLSFNPNALQMAFNEGNRNFGNWLLDRFNALCPELYAGMVKENSANVRNSDDDGNGRN
jgi:hypothetical protein